MTTTKYKSQLCIHPLIADWECVRRLDTLNFGGWSNRPLFEQVLLIKPIFNLWIFWIYREYSVLSFQYFSIWTFSKTMDAGWRKDIQKKWNIRRFERSVKLGKLLQKKWWVWELKFRVILGGTHCDNVSMTWLVSRLHFRNIFPAFPLVLSCGRCKHCKLVLQRMFLLLLLPEIPPPCQLLSFSDQKTPSPQNCPPIPASSVPSSPQTFFPPNFPLFSFSPTTKHVCTKFVF